jgi:hypothetical protein
VDFSFFSEEESAESCFEFVLGGGGRMDKGVDELFDQGRSYF